VAVAVRGLDGACMGPGWGLDGACRLNTPCQWLRCHRLLTTHALPRPQAFDCEQAISYLRSLVAQAAAGAAAEAAPAPKAAEAEPAPGMKLLKKKDDDEALFVGGAKKGKGAKREAARAAAAAAADKGAKVRRPGCAGGRARAGAADAHARGVSPPFLFLLAPRSLRPPSVTRATHTPRH
jgi:hypothetical protein